MALHHVGLRCTVVSGIALCWVGSWCTVLHCVVSNCGAVHDACAKLIPVWGGGTWTPQTSQSKSPPPSIQPSSWCLMGTDFWLGCCAREEGVCPRDKEGGGIDMLGGDASKGDPNPCSVQNGIWICRWGRTGWGQRAAREVAGIPVAVPPKPRSPHSLCNLGKVVPRCRSPALLEPRSCRRRRKVCGAGSGHGAARRGAGWAGGCLGCCGGAARRLREMLPAMLPRMLGSARGTLPRMLGMCLPGCSGGACRGAREVVGRCSPG